MRNRKLIIGMDLDGVLCDFDSRYQEQLNQIKGGPRIKYTSPTKWHFEEDMGFKRVHVEEFWNTVAQQSYFWEHLPALATQTDINTLNKFKNYGVLYYISKRPLHLQTTTQNWVNQKLPHAPVILTNNKGFIAKGLELDAMFDDKPQNLEHIYDTVQDRCKLFLVNRSWNRSYQNDKVIRIDRILEGFDILYKDVV